MRLLVTGANGFVGRAVTDAARAAGTTVRAAVRRVADGVPDGVELVTTGDLAAATDWRAALEGVDAVVHTAARVHVMRETAADPLAQFRHVNVDGTLHLARQAAAAGVRRFVFVSSIKVNGESTMPGRPFTAADAPFPVDPYGISKLEAEQGLFAIEQSSQLEIAVVRPVLVYGPGVKGNFRSMLRWLQRGLPLPLGAVHNQRSLVALDNLVDLLLRLVTHPAARSRVFLVSDDRDLSTPELLERAGRALGRPARLVPVPAALLGAAFRCAGKRDVAQRLCGSLQVDIQATREVLAWVPPVSVDMALERTACDFLRTHPQ